MHRYTNIRRHADDESSAHYLLLRQLLLCVRSPRFTTPRINLFGL